MMDAKCPERQCRMFCKNGFQRTLTDVKSANATNAHKSNAECSAKTDSKRTLTDVKSANATNAQKDNVECSARMDLSKTKMVAKSANVKKLHQCFKKLMVA